MQSDFVYRGRTVRAQDIEFIGRLIADHPTLSRRRLSAKLCAAWNWVQPNGRPRDMVARSLMLELHRVGHIQLRNTGHPPVQRNQPARRWLALWFSCPVLRWHAHRDFCDTRTLAEATQPLALHSLKAG